jgi:hypothetical protein
VKRRWEIAGSHAETETVGVVEGEWWRMNNVVE